MGPALLSKLEGQEITFLEKKMTLWGAWSQDSSNVRSLLSTQHFYPYATFALTAEPNKGVGVHFPRIYQYHSNLSPL